MNYDRFIPNRSSMDTLHSFDYFPVKPPIPDLPEDPHPSDHMTDHLDPYHFILWKTFFPGRIPNETILKYKNESPRKFSYIHRKDWTVPNKPFYILDAPECSTDFYSHTLEWNKHFITVALETQIYFFDFQKQNILSTWDVNDRPFSLAWNSHNLLAVGFGHPKMVLIDPGKSSRYSITLDRVTSGAQRTLVQWRSPNELVYSAHNTLHLKDIRTRQTAGNFSTQQDQICTIRCSSQIATGNDEGEVYVYDLRMPSPLKRYQNNTKAAVKALQWSPNSRRIAFGGGQQERTIRICNVNRANNNPTHSSDSPEQMTDLLWINPRLIITSHGYGATEKISFWDARTLKHKGSTDSRTDRVLSLALSPDKKNFCALSEDEQLSFWDISQLNSLPNRYSPRRFSPYDQIR